MYRLLLASIFAFCIDAFYIFMLATKFRWAWRNSWENSFAFKIVIQHSQLLPFT